MLDAGYRHTLDVSGLGDTRLGLDILLSGASALNVASGRTFQSGPDFDVIAVAYKFAWGDG